VRDEDQRPSSDARRYGEVRDGIRAERPEMVVQFSTGGRGRTQEERFSCLELRPEMASLATGSVNFPKQVYDNPPELVERMAARMLDWQIKPEIEVFDLAMLYTAANLVDRQLLAVPPHVQLVMGVRNALPPRESVVDFFVSELRALIPPATWTCAGIGRAQLTANHWALARGGHVRTGLEDNLYYEKGRLAESNAELVARVAALCAEHDRHPATAEETRRLLHLPAPAALGADVR
jgi:3-keto-5-aminohexanoate cleavage enzyme